MTKEESINPTEVAEVESPWRGMRTPRVVATCSILTFPLMGLLGHEWAGDVDWADRFFAAFMMVFLAGGAAWLLFLIWRRRTPKMDRVVLLISVGFLVGMVMSFVEGKLVPDAWKEASDWVLSVLLVVWHAWEYRKVERRWVSDGRLAPMPEGKPWPVMRRTWFGFIIVMTLWGVLFDELGVSGYDDEDVFGWMFWGLILPVWLAMGTIWLVKRGYAVMKRGVV